ncbi:MAG: hypothetical protein K1Y36_19330 [Blastocatellia bacterium]|nr:hypothetical protein [Blastocatellia bacterium]
MNSNLQDLWPDDLAVTKQLPPVVLLRRQASALGTKTNGLVEAEVRQFASGNAPFGWKFVLVAPVLDNYRIELFCVRHGLEFYPLEIFGNDIEKCEIPNEEKFLVKLAEIFASEKTLKIVRALLAQSQAFEIPA